MPILRFSALSLWFCTSMQAWAKAPEMQQAICKVTKRDQTSKSARPVVRVATFPFASALIMPEGTNPRVRWFGSYKTASLNYREPMAWNTVVTSKYVNFENKDGTVSLKAFYDQKLKVMKGFYSDDVFEKALNIERNSEVYCYLEEPMDGLWEQYEAMIAKIDEMAVKAQEEAPKRAAWIVSHYQSEQREGAFEVAEKTLRDFPSFNAEVFVRSHLGSKVPKDLKNYSVAFPVRSTSYFGKDHLVTRTVDCVKFEFDHQGRLAYFWTTFHPLAESIDFSCESTLYRLTEAYTPPASQSAQKEIPSVSRDADKIMADFLRAKEISARPYQFNENLLWVNARAKTGLINGKNVVGVLYENRAGQGRASRLLVTYEPIAAYK